MLMLGLVAATAIGCAATRFASSFAARSLATRAQASTESPGPGASSAARR